MLSFSGFRLEDGSPIYQQIIRYLEQGIAAGTIRDGDGFPPDGCSPPNWGSTPTPC